MSLPPSSTGETECGISASRLRLSISNPSASVLLYCSVNAWSAYVESGGPKILDEYSSFCCSEMRWLCRRPKQKNKKPTRAIRIDPTGIPTPSPTAKFLDDEADATGLVAAASSVEVEDCCTEI